MSDQEPDTEDRDYENEEDEFDQATRLNTECNVLFEDIDNGVNDLKREVNDLQFNSVENLADWQYEELNTQDEADQNSDDDYDLNRGERVRDLIINLGTNDLPRFSCANHKLNIGIKKAIKNHHHIKRVLRKLNK